jgi:hypothetical protein
MGVRLVASPAATAETSRRQSEFETGQARAKVTLRAFTARRTRTLRDSDRSVKRAAPDAEPGSGNRGRRPPTIRADGENAGPQPCPNSNLERTSIPG